jgi:hypothetical protein
MELSIKMFIEMGSESDEASNEDKHEYAHSLFSEIIFDLDTPYYRLQVEAQSGTISSSTSK